MMANGDARNVSRIVAISLLVSCGIPLGPGDDEVVAALQHDASDEFTIQILVPDTVHVHRSFPVSLTTYHGCRLEEGRTAMVVVGLQAMIVPYKRFLGSSVNCADFIAAPRRRVDMQFDETGIGTVTVVGLRSAKYPGEQADTIRVSRSVVVR